MKHKTESLSDEAFTRLELAMLVAALALLASMSLPLLANSKIRSEQIACLSNLRQIGHAVHLWANDHGDRTPWVTPQGEGGTRGMTNPLKENAWFQMGWMSNELATPQILVCPSDQRVGAPRKMANDFTNLQGGFFNPGFRNNSLSYLIGLHAVFELSRAMLGADRNIRWDSVNTGCGLGLSNVNVMNLFPVSVAWTNAIHGIAGNLLFSDGSAEQSSTAALQQIARGPSQSDNGVNHFLSP